MNLIQRTELEAEDVLPNINHTQATEMAKNDVFLSLLTSTFDLDIQTRPSEDQTHLSWSAVPEIFHTQTKKVTDSANNRT